MGQRPPPPAGPANVLGTYRGPLSFGAGAGARGDPVDRRGVSPSQPLQLQVTNVTGVGRTFTSLSDQPDIASVSAYIPAGVTQLVTLATDGGAVRLAVWGKLPVRANLSDPSSPGQPTLASFPQHAVGPPTHEGGRG